jgi:aryl-alcohol dehydrogenase-like predicted oxidoreductase
MQAVEGSLRRLQTDYIDIYQLHHPDDNTPVEEVLSTLDTLVKQGKVRYVGVSNHYAWQMAHMLGVSALRNWEPITSLQCRYNILDRAVESEILPFCERFDVATMIYSPLDGGMLTGKYKRDQELPERARWTRYIKQGKKLAEETFDILEKLEEIAARYEIGMNQLAIAWLLARPAVTSVIMGGYKPEHFDTIYPVLDLKIEQEDLAAIDEISESCRYRPFHNQAVVHGFPLALNRW